MVQTSGPLPPALPPLRDRADQAWRLAPKHPLQMRAVFRRCWLINLSMPVQTLAAHLPPPLEPDVHHGRAWLSVVLASMEDMRPCLAPAWAAVAFDQVVYRAVVRHEDLPGVFFLRTDANHLLYAWAGDLLTFFRFHYHPIRLALQGDVAQLEVQAPGAELSARLDHAAPPDPMPGSPFETVAQAKPALVDRYHAFSVHPRTGRVGRVTVNRKAWEVRAVGVEQVALPWADHHLPGHSVDSALFVENVPYTWSRYASGGQP